jgi:hypothetical protein
MPLDMIIHANNFSADGVNYSFWDDTFNNSVYKPSGRPSYPKWEMSNVVSGVILLICTVVGSALNVFIIIAIVPNRRLRTVRNILLVHLAVVGILSSVITTLFSAVVVLTGSWIGGDLSCQIYGFLQSSFTMVTTWIIAGLSWDKYNTIASPLHHSLTATMKKMSCLFSMYWLFAIVIALPPLLGGSEYVFHRIQGICFINHLHIPGHWYLGIALILMFYLPLSVMLYCYMHIFKIARTQSSRIAATMVRMACVVQVPIAPNSQATQMNSSSIKGTKAMMTIFQLIGAFALTYIPYSIVIIIEACIGKEYIHTLLHSVVTTLYLSAPTINGAVYGIRNKILRNSFYIYTRRKIQRIRYKDKRKGSIRRSSSFRMSLLQRKNNQNGDVGGLRRTQSLQPRHVSRQPKDGLRPPSDANIRKAHSFTMGNGHAALQLPVLEVDEPNGLSDVSNKSLDFVISPPSDQTEEQMVQKV